MALSSSQRAKIVNAFLDAFRSYPDLRYMLLTQFEDNIEVKMPVGGALKDIVLDLVLEMESQGRLKELLRGALKHKPQNPHLIACGVEFELYTPLESVSLPPLHLKEFSRPAHDVLLTHRDMELTAWPSDYYREEGLIAASDARRMGITEKTLYAILSIQTLSLDNPIQQVAIRLLVNEHVKPGSLYINQQLGESIGLLSHGGRSWFISQAKASEVGEVSFQPTNNSDISRRYRKSSDIPPLPQPVRTDLIAALLRLPGIQRFEGRSSLLRALPSVDTLDRNSNNTKQDLVGIVDQLSHLGQTSSRQWPLILLLDTAVEDIRGYTLEEDIKQLRQQLVEHYGDA